MTHPLITVLMPVYNGEKYLREAIDSILNQTYGEFEFLIINDGSTDKTEEIVLSYQDNRIRYIRNEKNMRLIATLNRGIELANGKYIARMDADDISLPKRVERQVRFMEENKDVIVAGTWYEYIGAKKGITKYPVLHNEIKVGLLYSCPICHPSVIWRIDKDREHFDENFLHAEDYELWTRLIQGGRFANIPEVLFQYRIHTESVSRSNASTQLQNSLKIRELQFKKMGIAVSKCEVEMYAELCYANWNYFNSTKTIKEMQVLLERILNANNRTAYILPSFYQKYILEKWFHLNYNCGNEKLFYSLSIAHHLTLSNKIKIKIRSILK